MKRITITLAQTACLGAVLSAGAQAALVKGLQPSLLLGAAPDRDYRAEFVITEQLRVGLPVGWTITQLPPGLAFSFDGNRAVLSGRPTQEGVFKFDISWVQNCVSTPNNRCTAKIGFGIGYELRVGGLRLTTTALPDGRVGSGYFVQLTATGGGKKRIWDFTGFPRGLAVSALSDFANVIGMPADGGTFDTTISVSDEYGQRDQKSFRLRIEGGSGGGTTTTPGNPTTTSGLAITTPSLPGGPVNQPYTAQVNAAGGTPEYAFSASSLPPGLAMNQTGLIQGTPTATGTFNSVGVKVTDKVGAVASRTYAITIATAASSILTITTQSLPGTEAGVTYAQTLTASGGRVPYRWYHRGGTLPTGVNLDRGSGQISGVPQDQGTFRFTVEVEDAAETAATADLSITVGASQLRIVTPRLFDETLGKRMEAFTLKATGGKEPLEWQATGLPDGLQLSSTGVLTGTPTKVGMFAGIQVTVRDADRKTASHTYSMRIRDAVLAITTESLPKAYKGRAYRADILTAFAQGLVRYSVAGATPFAPPPKLPGGLSLGSATGVIDGTATETGSFPFNVLAVDSGRSDSKAFTLIVEEPPPALTITLSDAVPATVVGEVLTLTALGKGGDRSRYEYSFSDPKPVGMSIDPRSGVVSVSAVRPGVINGIVRLTDGDQTVTIPLGVKVYEPLSCELLPPCGNATTSKLRAADNNCSPDAAPPFAETGQQLTYAISCTGGVLGQQRNLGLSLSSTTASGEVKVSGVSTSGITPGIIMFNKSMPVDHYCPAISRTDSTV